MNKFSSTDIDNISIHERIKLYERTITANAMKKEMKNVFLSHSSKDDKHIPAVIKFLEDHGGSVYVDDGDDRLPEKPSKETAAILRETIQQLPRFIVFVTEGSKDSRWIPWELGLADAYKFWKNVAVLPASKHSFQTEWSEREYLGIYRRIVYGSLEGSGNVWMVYDSSNNTAQTLDEWLGGR